MARAGDLKPLGAAAGRLAAVEMQELRVLGRVLAVAVVVALAWAMMGAGSRASLAPWVMPALVAGVTVSNVKTAT